MSFSVIDDEESYRVVAETGKEGLKRAASSSDAMPRIALVDYLRGVALLGMIVFHFVYDPEFFGLEERGDSKQLHWWTLATVFARSFLFSHRHDPPSRALL